MSKSRRNKLRLPVQLSLFIVLSSMSASVMASMTGQTSLINMPDARIGQDGEWRIGAGYAKPYQSFWTSFSLLPNLEFSGRYTRIMEAASFNNTQSSATYGDYKDKSFDIKLKLWDEGAWYPSVAVGAQDFVGTPLFAAQYVVASKKINNLDMTLGYGRKRIDGAFAGLRYRPAALPSWAVVAEYDANNYKLNHAAGADYTPPMLKNVNAPKKGIAFGLEHHWGWITSQLNYQHKELGGSVYMTIPLQAREFIAKTDEPASYSSALPRPTTLEWLANPKQHQAYLHTALQSEGFRNIHSEYHEDTLYLVLTNQRISELSRNIGRAVRASLQVAPIEIKKIQVTYVEQSLPVATYTFEDIPQLVQYLDGKISREEAIAHIQIRQANPEDSTRLYAQPTILDEVGLFSSTQLTRGDAGSLLQLQGETMQGTAYKIAPYMDTFLNDPSGAFKFELGLFAHFQTNFTPHTQLVMTGTGAVYENITDVKQPSNSLLPHVRSDVADYKRAARFKLSRLLLNHTQQLDTAWYGRASFGLYEEMFGGLGGQMLYAPADSAFAFDVSGDWLKQRDVKNPFGFRDYQTLTGIAALHYKLPRWNVTATIRAGRFLAKDVGARFELKRRFNSGYELGFWYSRTNAHDRLRTGDKVDYFDKGVYFSMPLNSLTTQDSQAVSAFRIAPWTRDVAQMVASPQDLYDTLEKPLLLDLKKEQGLSRFTEREAQEKALTAQ